MLPPDKVDRMRSVPGSVATGSSPGDLGCTGSRDPVATAPVLTPLTLERPLT